MNYEEKVTNCCKDILYGRLLRLLLCIIKSGPYQLVKVNDEAHPEDIQKDHLYSHKRWHFLTRPLAIDVDSRTCGHGCLYDAFEKNHEAVDNLKGVKEAVSFVLCPAAQACHLINICLAIIEIMLSIYYCSRGFGVLGFWGFGILL